MKQLAISVSVLAITIGLGNLAHAADPVDGVHDWSGFYLGVHGGFGGADVEGLINPGGGPGGPGNFETEGFGVVDFDLSGMVGGAQTGFNWQSGNLVLGFEGDITFTDFADQPVSGNPLVGITVAAETDVLASLRAKAGYAVQDVLLFATVGGAISDTTYHAADNRGPSSGSINLDDVGIVAGGGIEYALGDGWSLRTEGLYYMFGDRQDASGLISLSEPGDFIELDDIWVVRAGINLHL